MSNPDITYRRLYSQRLGRRNAFAEPADVVRWFGALQAQEYPSALWAIALRMPEGTTIAEVECAVAERKILRTWPMRGTIHFVAPEDVRWILDLTAERTIRAHRGRMVNQLGIDDDTLSRSRKLIVDALEGDRQMSRPAIYKMLEANGIATANQRGVYILWRLSHEGLLCISAHEGRQPAFALLDEWAPNTTTLSRDEALAEFARRYFTSHGPATVRDYVWWSGLTVTEANRGIHLAGDALVSEGIDGQTYWLSPDVPSAEDAAVPPPTAHLLPAYDEYTVAHRDRTSILPPGAPPAMSSTVLFPCVVIDGEAAGTWKRSTGKRGVEVTLSPFRPLSSDERAAVERAAAGYARFLGQPLASVR